MHMQVKTVRRSGYALTPRQGVFRAVRMVIALAVAAGLGFAAWRAMSVVRPNEAFLNAEIISVRAPIAGELNLRGLQPGAEVAAAAPLFRITNPQFANTPVASELTRVQELVERLRIESEEAEAQIPKLEEIFKHAAAMNREKLISPVQFMQEEAKLAAARLAASKKREQLELASKRLAVTEAQAAALRETAVSAAFDGVVWSAPLPNGSFAQPQETVMQLINAKRIWVDAYLPERHAGKFPTGTRVKVRLLNDKRVLSGCVESVRAGVGRIPVGSANTVAPGELTQRRVAVRVKLDPGNPFSPAEFYGVGRSVTIEL
jgi:multidrug resistance efflux pump